MRTHSKVNCYFEWDDGQLVAVIHCTARFVSIEIADSFTLPPSIGYYPFFDRPQWLEFLKQSKDRLYTKPIAGALLNQQLFNGVGNWMRAEILHLTNLAPFDSLGSILESEAQMSQLFIAMDTVLHRTLTLMEKGFDINSVAQQRAFNDSLLAYGKGQRVLYSRIGSKQTAKAL